MSTPVFGSDLPLPSHNALCMLSSCGLLASLPKDHRRLDASVHGNLLYEPLLRPVVLYFANYPDASSQLRPRDLSLLQTRLLDRMRNLLITP